MSLILDGTNGATFPDSSTQAKAGLVAGGTVATGTITTLTTATLSDGVYNTATTNAIKGSAKAWVSFIGSTGVLRGSFNVSSITRNAVGTYVCNFSTALIDNNYSAVGAASSNGTTAYGGTINMNNAAGLASVAPSTSAFSFLVTNSGGTLYDPAYVNLIVLGN
jgi:hypothetical protein